MNELRKQKLLAYCKLSSEDLSQGEKSLLEDIFYASEDYMRNAGVRKPSDPGRKASYDLLVNALCLDAWERRDVTITGAVLDNPGFRRRLNQLKLTETEFVSDSDTGEAGDPA